MRSWGFKDLQGPLLSWQFELWIRAAGRENVKCFVHVIPGVGPRKECVPFNPSSNNLLPSSLCLSWVVDCKHKKCGCLIAGL